jgi:hypothetical protein
MNPLVSAAFGWLVPGGAYLLARRYLQFVGFAAVVLATFGAGLVLDGGSAWPQPGELAGLDGFTALLFRAGAVAKMMAGGPYLAAQFFDGTSFAAGRVHEQGTTLLAMAGLFNLLAIASALDLGKGRAR